MNDIEARALGKLLLGPELTPDDVARLLGPVVTPEMADKMCTPGGGPPPISETEALFWNDLTIYWSRLIALAGKMPLDLDPEFDAVTKPAQLLTEIMAKRHMTVEDKFLEFALRKEIRDALRTVGIGDYLACESFFK